MSVNISLNITGNLSDLQDIIVPESVGFFPLAPAWYAAGGIIAFLLIRAIAMKYKAFRENKYRRDAEIRLNHLEKIILAPNEVNGQIKAAAALPALLKQTAISAYKRATVAELSQDRWLAFLDGKSPVKGFLNDTGRLLSRCAYGTPKEIGTIPKESLKELISLIRKWIRKHEKEQA